VIGDPVIYIARARRDRKDGPVMATLTVWKFETPDAADGVRERLLALQKQDLINVHDAVVVTWPADAKKPSTKQLTSTTGLATAGGAFWGLLLGIIFFIPWFGLAFGAAMGALSGSLTDVGIDDDFIKTVRDEVTPGTSALFLLSSDAVADHVRDEMSDVSMKLIATNLSVDDEQALLELFEN
jgi:uncharacterized membrane protein